MLCELGGKSKSIETCSGNKTLNYTLQDDSMWIWKVKLMALCSQKREWVESGGRPGLAARE